MLVIILATLSANEQYRQLTSHAMYFWLILADNVGTHMAQTPLSADNDGPCGTAFSVLILCAKSLYQHSG